MAIERDAAEELEVLEGDEGEVEIKRPRDCGRLILETRISDLTVTNRPIMESLRAVAGCSAPASCQ